MENNQETKPNTVKGYKAFDKDMKCRGFQFEVGKTYETDGDPKLCNNGFHFCENPLDIFKYYNAGTSLFAEVEGEQFTELEDGCSKRAAKKLTIKASLKLGEIVDIGVTFILNKVDEIVKKANAHSSTAVARGSSSTAVARGSSSTAVARGSSSTAVANAHSSTAVANAHSSTAVARGSSSTAVANAHSSTAVANESSSTAVANATDSIAIVAGYDSKAKAVVGSFIVLSERDENNKLIDVKAFKVDGKKIKSDVFYKLVNGKAVRVK